MHLPWVMHLRFVHFLVPSVALHALGPDMLQVSFISILLSNQHHLFLPNACLNLLLVLLVVGIQPGDVDSVSFI